MSATTEKRNGGKTLIVVILIAAVIGVIAIKNRNGQEPTDDRISGAEAAADEAAPGDAVSDKIPTLIDLGSKSCIPCKMMEPILANLKTEYAGRMKVVFIDVWKNQDAGKQYGIRVIPTQIFFDADGEELFRHEGFMSREDILGKWRELGVAIEKKEEAAPEADTPSSSAHPDNSDSGI